MSRQTVPSDDLNARIRRGEAIKGLMEHPGWTELLAEINDKRIAEMRTLENKVTDSGAQYAHKMGGIRALRQVEELAEKAVARGAQAEHLIRERESEAA